MTSLLLLLFSFQFVIVDTQSHLLHFRLGMQALSARRFIRCGRPFYRCLSQYTQDSDKQMKGKKDTGQFHSDTYPDISLFTTRKDKLVESLVKRIRVDSHSKAEELVDELEDRFRLYETCRDQLLQVSAELHASQKEAAGSQQLTDQIKARCLKLEDYTRIAKCKRSKLELREAHSDLIKHYNSMPNVVDDASLSINLPSDMPDLEHLKAPSFGGLTDLKRPHTERSYLTGRAALLELELADFTSHYLEEHYFEPVTCPSFLRREVTELTGASTVLPSDIYTLLTKPELHAKNNTSPSRKPKVEDHFVYQAQGLTELALMTLFLRLHCKMLPIRLYSLGNQYRMPYSGKPVQSKMGVFLTASQTEEDAVQQFFFGICFIERFWRKLNIDTLRHSVEPHQLAQHEASAVEFVLDSPSKFRPVLSRISLIYDYVARRMMSYSSHHSYDYPNNSNNKFCHFTTGELIDINLLLSTF